MIKYRIRAVTGKTLRCMYKMYDSDQEESRDKGRIEVVRW